MPAKGVSAVISIILLLLVTISLVGMVYTFFVSQTETLTSGLKDDTQNTLDQLSTKVRIVVVQQDGTNPVKIYMRNTGTRTISDLSTIVIFIDGKFELGDWKNADDSAAADMAPGETVYFVPQAVITSCSNVKVDTPGQGTSASC
ncbi:MAG: hypothetical protein HY365_03575 [Candidatus Aenigmarchaeota archaeon]|nr:hypothetical protein [Candidatus Aenigmarchaeota archaeon]